MESEAVIQDLNLVSEPESNNPLLVLDIDETLISTKRLSAKLEPLTLVGTDKDDCSQEESQRALERLISITEPADLLYKDGVDVYSIVKRPGLDYFLRQVSKHYKIAIWSAASDHYVNFVVDNIIRPITNPVFVWSSKRTIFKRSLEMHGEFTPNNLVIIKPLQKLWRRGKYNKYNTIVIDDNYSTFSRNYGNAIPISEFNRDSTDIKLNTVWEVFLSKLITSKNIRHDLTVLKNNWIKSKI